MRVLLLVVVLALGVVYWTILARQVRALRQRGQKTSGGAAMTLALLLPVWILALGYSVGYAIADSSSGGLIGFGVAVGATLVVGPLVRVREVQRRASRG